MHSDNLFPEPLSGTWRGWWRQGLREGHEALRLTVTGRRIQGSGQDQDGAFALEGVLQPDGSAVLTKRYTLPALQTIERRACLGQWNGRVLRGTWADERAPQSLGPFLMWPSQE